MNNVIRNKVPENGNRSYFHSANRLFVEEIDEYTIKPERAVQMLKEDGLVVTIEQANIILEFLYKLADIALSQYLPK
jgi:hypothetical protein